MNPRLSPVPIFDALVAYQRSAALAAAIEFDVFTAIGAGATSAALLAKQCKASERGVRSLCDYLVADGFLSKSGESYGLGEVAAAFLDRRSPTYLGSIATFLNGDMLRRAFGELPQAVRAGKTAIGKAGSMDPDHPAWRDFARSMASAMAPAAAVLAQMLVGKRESASKILDIAAGHGLWGITAAQRWPTARLVLQDWKSVLEIALENARNAGLGERTSTLPGSAHEIDLGTGYDLVLVPHFLHHFDAARCEQFLRRVKAAMQPGGTVAVVEFLVDEDRVSPPPAAKFSLVMLATTDGGDAYTQEEMRGLLERSGFREVEIRELEGLGAHAAFGTA